VTQVSATPAPPPAPAAISLLVGEAHSRNEAFALVVRLTSQRGAELGPRRPQIAETQFADTSIYRLRLGPFTDQSQAMALCRSLRDSGYECVSE
jgi:cell division septation protein DedD